MTAHCEVLEASAGAENIDAAVARLRGRAAWPRAQPVAALVELFDEYARRLLADPRVRSIEGLSFLCAWLSRDNLTKLLQQNLHGRPEFLDGFQPQGRGYLAAMPHGLVAMWLAGNVGTLPLFSLVPGWLTKNVCLVKLASVDVDPVGRLLEVLSETSAGSLSGADLLQTSALVAFDHHRQSLSEAMSRAADARVIWGSEGAVQGITALERPSHCVDIVFGPKYSIGVVDRKLIERPEMDDKLDAAIAGLVRDAATFDQRGCSAPQTVFVERNARLSLRELGERFAAHFSRLPARVPEDAYTTSRIMDARADWALDESRDVISSSEDANWTVCMDREVRLKEAVQSRTLFLTEVESWHDVVPLVSPRVQTVGIAFADREDAVEFSAAATAAGAARCVRPGLMNVHESPWDGRYFLHDLVRWVSCKP